MGAAADGRIELTVDRSLYHSLRRMSVIRLLTPVTKAYSSTRLRRRNVADLPKHGTNGGDRSGGLGLIGIDLFAPNDLSLHFFTVGPFNE